MNYTFKGNFGTLELVVDDNGKASGTYQKGGTLLGKFKDDVFEGECSINGIYFNRGFDMGYDYLRLAEDFRDSNI